MAAARRERLRRNAPAAGRPAAAVLPGLAGELRGLVDKVYSLDVAEVLGDVEEGRGG
jgi:hypothetical protein